MILKTGQEGARRILRFVDTKGRKNREDITGGGGVGEKRRIGEKRKGKSMDERGCRRKSKKRGKE